VPRLSAGGPSGGTGEGISPRRAFSFKGHVGAHDYEKWRKTMNREMFRILLNHNQTLVEDRIVANHNQTVRVAK